MITRARHLTLGLVVAAGLLLSGRRRALFSRMRTFVRALPERLSAPLPEAMAALDARMEPTTLSEGTARGLADVAALVDRGSPLGLCLRRSLVRRHFLAGAGVALDVHFGARLDSDTDAAPGTADGPGPRVLSGHAWTAVGGDAYHERADNYDGFTTIVVWPGRDDGRP